LKIGETEIEDTFAEAFGMRWTRLIVTADDEHWVDEATRAVTGYASSVIACDSEMGVERKLSADETPDGRPGAAVLAFGFSAEALGKAIPNRVGQCVMTCPTTAAFDGNPAGLERISLGKHIRFFGDGFQRSKKFSAQRFWRIPVMDGEFLVADVLGVSKGVGGGNLILQGVDSKQTLAAARAAVEAIAELAGVITPFPSGVVRSGSKVGSVYKKLPASTADAYCPTLRGMTGTKLHPQAQCAYEIVIDGVDESAVRTAMTIALHTAAQPGILHIGAGNYGGKLGKFHFHLKELM
jgi:formylmethanofuran--tetrahydromethanopterin N-formyltransferase